MILLREQARSCSPHQPALLHLLVLVRALVAAHQLRLVEHMARHGLLDLLLGGPLRQVQARVERVELEVVAMLGVRRTRTEVVQVVGGADAMELFTCRYRNRAGEYEDPGATSSSRR